VAEHDRPAPEVKRFIEIQSVEDLASERTLEFRVLHQIYKIGAAVTLRT
jgi:hypothetical protein